MERRMRPFLLLTALGVLSAGCNGNGGAGAPGDPDPVYEAVLKEELKGANKGEGFYVFVDGKDPAPELLKRLQKQWPELQPGSKAPKGKANCIGVDSLKWINRDAAELHGGGSNGFDGRSSLYRVVHKDGAWVVESVKLEAIS
jgi:hypothetical protein